RGRRVTLAVPFGESPQVIAQRGPLGVGPAERAAEERWEAEAHDRTEVALGRRAQDALVEAARGLVHEQEREAARGLLVVPLRAGRHPDERVDVRIRCALLAVVAVE